MKSTTLFCMAVAFLALGQLAGAQTPSVTSKLTASEVEIVAGKTILRSADQAKPGDTVEYRATYTNNGYSAIKDLVAIVPVPVGTALVANSASPAANEASTDGKNFSRLPLMRTVHGADGKDHQEAVPLTEYRALRWSVGGLDSKATATVGLRVLINPTFISPPVVAATH